MGDWIADSWLEFFESILQTGKTMPLLAPKNPQTHLLRTFSSRIFAFVSDCIVCSRWACVHALDFN